MVQNLYQYKENECPFTWIDIIDPEPGELEEVALQYNLNNNTVEDCLEPLHLPKLEHSPNAIFVVLRHFDDNFGGLAERIQQITRKVAIFVGENFVITIRRKHTRFFSNFLTLFEMTHKNQAPAPLIVLISLIEATIQSYERPLEIAENKMDTYESYIFKNALQKVDFEEFYKFKREMALIKKMLKQTENIVLLLNTSLPDEYKSTAQNVKELSEKLYFQAEELLHDSNHLLNMYLSIGSFRQNEIVRVLTIFSVFFLPLMFITGIYGMNFEFMPELKEQWGYPTALIGMVAVAISLYFWFRHKKWL